MTTQILMPHKILIIDDQISFINYMVDVLEQAYPNFEIFQSTLPEKAIEIALKERPNLIILDWAMPGMTGIDLIKKFKSTPELKDIPVIMCTGVMTQSAHLEEAFKAGAVDFIRKPIDELELIARVNSIMQLSDSFWEIKTLLAHRDKLFSIVAHDLKDPMSNLTTMFDIILSQDDLNLNHDNYILLESGRNAVAETSRLLEDLLLWANSQRNRIEFHFQVQDVITAIDRLKPTYASLLNQKQIALDVKGPDAAYCWFDFNSVKTILRNLIGNAIKFTHPGGNITIEVEANGQFTQVKVTDTGVGIHKNNIDKIFNTSENFSTYGTAGEKGSGLGLLLCKELIDKNQGEIDVESTEGKGSTFFFKLRNQKPADSE